MLDLKGSHRFERSFVDGGFSPFRSRCTKGCGGGTQERKRGVKVHAAHAGAGCTGGSVEAWTAVGKWCEIMDLAGLAGLSCTCRRAYRVPKHFPYEGLVHPRILSMCSWVLFTKCGYLHVTKDLGRPAKHSFSRIVMNRLFLQRIEDLPLFSPSGQNIFFVVFFVGWTRTQLWPEEIWVHTSVTHLFYHRWKTGFYLKFTS